MFHLSPAKCKIYNWAQMFILNDVVQFEKIKLLDNILLLAWYINKEFFFKKKDSKNITHCVNGIDL